MWEGVEVHIGVNEKKCYITNLNFYEIKYNAFIVIFIANLIKFTVPYIKLLTKIMELIQEKTSSI